MQLHRSMFTNPDGTPTDVFMRGTFDAIALLTQLRDAVAQAQEGHSTQLEADFLFGQLADAVRDDTDAAGVVCGLFVLANALISPEDLQETAAHLALITGGPI